MRLYKLLAYCISAGGSGGGGHAVAINCHGPEKRLLGLRCRQGRGSPICRRCLCKHWRYRDGLRQQWPGCLLGVYLNDVQAHQESLGVAGLGTGSGDPGSPLAPVLALTPLGWAGTMVAGSSPVHVPQCLPGTSCPCQGFPWCPCLRV